LNDNARNRLTIIIDNISRNPKPGTARNPTLRTLKPEQR
jgi:hypothetical protein